MTDRIGDSSLPIDLLRKYDRPGPRYTSYPTAPVWSDAVGNETYRRSLEKASSRTADPLSIYCHIPFCRRRCFYCGCNTCITNKRSTVEGYIECMYQELETVRTCLGDRRAVSQVHFGGGTPTYLTVDELGGVLDRLEDAFTFDADCEKSVEIDPRVTSEEQLSFLRSRGFNRVSIGVQDFDHSVQEAAGRVQSYEMVAQIMQTCRSLGFGGINIDLIYGLPLQTVESFGVTLDRAIGLRPDRVAVYSFAYLPKLKANQARIDPDGLPDTELKYKLFALAVDKFCSAGYRQIGMDHFAVPDDELSIAQADGRLNRNFMGYTVQASDEMIGLGMSSIGYIDDTFFQNHSGIDAYRAAIAESGLAVYRGKALNKDDLIRRYVITSLMCNFQLRFSDLRDRFGLDYESYFGDLHANLEPMKQDGFIEETGEGLHITPLGRTFVRNIAMVYDAYFKSAPDGSGPTFSRTI